MYVLLIGTNCLVTTLITSCAATPPINAAMECNSAAPQRHLNSEDVEVTECFIGKMFIVALGDI